MRHIILFRKKVKNYIYLATVEIRFISLAKKNKITYEAIEIPSLYVMCVCVFITQFLSLVKKKRRCSSQE
jgi:hypothetical protein